MTISVVKAGQIVAARSWGGGKITVVRAGQLPLPKPSGTAAVAYDGPKQVLRPPRAVTKEEAPFIQPARTSTTTSMMPWRGWFQRFLKEKVLSESQFKKFREFVFFAPYAPYDGYQSGIPSEPIRISATDPTVTAQYRWPSPGSVDPAKVNVPQFSADEDPYDGAHFKRDTTRRYLTALGNPELEKLKVKLMGLPPEEEESAIAEIEAGPKSSPGNQGRFATGPSDFDPTGLRATMSCTWKELEKSLDSHMPDHLPTPVWVGHEAEIIKWHEDRDLPVPVGGYYQPLKVPVERRIARW